MRILLAFLVLLPVFSLSQTEEKKTFMGFGIEGAFNLLDEPTLSFEEFSAVVGDPSFVNHAETAELSASSKLFTRNGLALRMMFRGPNHENLGLFKQSRFNVGIGCNAGNNYSFEFRETSRIRVDTIYVDDGSEVQTLYRDTIFYKDSEYSAKSKNFGIFGEYLLFTHQEKTGFATGIGLAADVTFLYDAQVRSRTNKETGLYDLTGNPVYAGVIVDPVSGSSGIGTGIYHNFGEPTERKLKTAYFIRPYIPVRIEAILSNRPKMNNFTIDINAKLGTEIQFNPGASVNARMFYSLGLGLNYYL